MLTHAQIWEAIDLLAAEHGMTVSGLARRSGLDPTTFNRSKRITREGKARWPSTESISKILEATATPLDRFYALLRDRSVQPARAVPLARFDSVHGKGSAPADPKAAAPLAEFDDPAIFAIEVNGSGLEPVYRHGTILFVSPAASVQAGDQIFVSTEEGKAYVGKFVRRDPRQLQIRTISGDGESVATIDKKAIQTLARIVWAAL